MPAIAADPAAARAFALQVVSQLRAARHEALWAGGCVRDELLGRTPADYDVATSARPDEVRTLFGHRRTLAVGAAFGVITVIGPRSAGHVEVTTFRADADYTDGRHPAGVRFTIASEDAQRRDFTINGLFFDPLEGRVHDYVGGQADLERGIVRAIGVPSQRFAEDHLRMLRAVRFTAGFGFVLEAETRAAVERMAALVTSVSPERVAAELRLMVSRPGRAAAVELLEATGLAGHVLPEIAAPAGHPLPRSAWARAARVISALDEPGLPQALATLFEAASGPAPPPASSGGSRDPQVARMASRLRLSTMERDTTDWLLAAMRFFATCKEPETLSGRPWSAIQPWLASPKAPLLADLLRARAAADQGSPQVAAWVSDQLTRPHDELDPAPLVSGHDLMAWGVAKGREIGHWLAEIRRLQLDGELSSAEAARAWVGERCGRDPTA